ncbi:MAG: TRAP transporter small permease [Rectinema sp.]|nr:TRAP transporter small permease [Rectinema sp.]
MQAKLFSIINRIERFLTAISAALMGMLSVIVCWQVFARYVLKKSPYWVEEFSVTAMMWIGLLGAAAAVWSGDHMSLRFFIQKLPRRLSLVAELIIDAAIGYFAMFLFTQGLVITDAMKTSMMSTIPVSLGVSYVIIPIAAGFMIVFAALRILRKVFEIMEESSERSRNAR